MQLLARQCSLVVSVVTVRVRVEVGVVGIVGEVGLVDVASWVSVVSLQSKITVFDCCIGDAKL